MYKFIPKLDDASGRGGELILGKYIRVLFYIALNIKEYGCLMAGNGSVVDIYFVTYYSCRSKLPKVRQGC